MANEFWAYFKGYMGHLLRGMHKAFIGWPRQPTLALLKLRYCHKHDRKVLGKTFGIVSCLSFSLFYPCSELMVSNNGNQRASRCAKNIIHRPWN